MDYERHYTALINKAQERGWIKETAPCYVETHHIVPRAIGAGNEPRNLVCLTAKEHFVAHHLLWRGCRRLYGKEDWRTVRVANAFYAMSLTGKGRQKVSAREFNQCRQAKSEAVKADPPLLKLSPARRRQANLKAKATMGPERRREAALKGVQTMGPERRRESLQRAVKTRGLEGYRKSALQAAKTIGKERYKEIIRKGRVTMGPERRREAALKAKATMGPERRSEAVRKGRVAMGPERRREAARKSSEKIGKEGYKELARKRQLAMTPEKKKVALAKRAQTVSLARFKEWYFFGTRQPPAPCSCEPFFALCPSSRNKIRKELGLPHNSEPRRSLIKAPAIRL